MKRRSFIGAITSFLLLPLREIAEAMCNPALVRFFHQDRQLVQARGNSGKNLALGSYFLQWYGHSSFLIHSGSQTKVVADPNFNVTPRIQADAVTISNDHFTHNNTGAVTGNPVILRGITFKQTWQPIRTSVKDITIHAAGPASSCGHLEPPRDAANTGGPPAAPLITSRSAGFRCRRGSSAHCSQ